MPTLDLEKVVYETHPAQYQHWRLTFAGEVATLTLDTKEDGGIRPGYKLKLNSYDLGVDIELHDAIQRIRFEHPEVRVVVLTSAKPRVFCSGANIYMLGLSSHAWKVNFCKFTNETRNGIEDASLYSGLKFIAACNGSTAGGGYELALACDEIILIDDRSSAVSLPEIPLLGVLPGTGGLTRLTDKRRVRKDHADIFCTQSEGLQGQRAKDQRFVDTIAKPQQFAEVVAARAAALAAMSDRPSDAAGGTEGGMAGGTEGGMAGGMVGGMVGGGPRTGVALTPIKNLYVKTTLDHEARTATITVRTPKASAPAGGGVNAALPGAESGADWWPLAMARELDNAILDLRTNELELGLWILKTEGDPETVLAYDEMLIAQKDHWFVREVIGQLRRTFARLEVSARSLFAVVEPGSCFAGTLLELALACDRIYIHDAEENAPSLYLSPMNTGPLPMVNGMTRLSARFYGDVPELAAKLGPREAESAGLVTAAIDDLDWADELRQAMEVRTALSPDALTGMEASLRFGPGETMETRIFGRLSAWQNWIFVRPNAVGPTGALKLYGTGNRAKFSWERV